MHRTFLSLFCSSLMLASCTASQPSLMLVIDAEPGVRARSESIALEVRGADDAIVFSMTYDTRQRSFPIRKSFVPRGGDLSRFIVATISAFESGSTAPLLVSRIRSGFANGQNEVRVMLLDGCIGQPCTAGNTCVVESGSPRCVPTPEVLPVRDAGVVDSSTADASTSDAATCTPDCQGRNCGIDPRCGTSCGTCTAGRCNTDRGVCEDVACSPNCTGRMCGADPTCGQSCGTCASGTCNASGQCEVACMPDCQGRTCGTESRCNTSCGSCDAPQVCSTAGRCETMTSNGPRFLDAPTVTEEQPIAVGASFTITTTVTDPQGLNTIVAGEVRNPTGAAGGPGRYAMFTAPPGSGQFSATVLWSAFAATNGGLPEDVSGNTMRTLRIRFIDQEGNELVQDIAVRLGGCAQALCAGRCAACPANEAGRMCVAGACLATACSAGNHVCAGQCASNMSVNTCGANCAPCQLANATATCQENRCTYACNRGYRLNPQGQCASPWVRLTPAHSPPARTRGGLVYDASRDRTYLFGGYDFSNGSVTNFNDSWSWDGTDWSRIEAATPPAARGAFMFVYDPLRMRSVLSGGAHHYVCSYRPDNDCYTPTVRSFAPGYGTHEFDGMNWTERDRHDGLIGAAGVFDQTAGGIYQFGGDDLYESGRVSQSENAVLTGSGWSARPDLTVWYYGAGMAAAFDPISGSVVAYGGYRNCNSGCSDGYLQGTRLRDSNGAWTTLNAAQPGTTSYAAMAYHEALGRIVMQDGSQTWQWTRTEWTEIPSAQSPSSGVMAYDSARREIVLFDDAGVTWAFRLLEL